MLGGLFVQCSWRDDPTAIGWKHMYRNAIVSLLNQLKLQILLSWHNFLMMKVYSTWRMIVIGMQDWKEKYNVIIVYHMILMHGSLKKIEDMEMGAELINWFKMQFLAKKLTKLFLKMIHQNRSRRLKLSEVEHCLRKWLIFIFSWLLYFMIFQERKVTSLLESFDKILTSSTWNIKLDIELVFRG